MCDQLQTLSPCTRTHARRPVEVVKEVLLRRRDATHHARLSPQLLPSHRPLHIDDALLEPAACMRVQNPS